MEPPTYDWHEPVPSSTTEQELPCQFCVLNPSYFPFLKIFPRAFFGSGPVVHSGGDGRTGGGGPGGLGVHGGMGIFIPLFLSLGAC